MRKPHVENKYNLKFNDIKRAIVLNQDKLTEHPFWRNDLIKAWCLSGGGGLYDGDFIDEYLISFYDKDAAGYLGKIEVNCTSYEGMCGYDFKHFFDPNEIECEADLELQENLLRRINWLIDEKIIKI